MAETNSLNDGLGEKSGNPIDLSSDDSAARVHVAHDEEIKPSVQTSGKQKWRFGIILVAGVIASRLLSPLIANIQPGMKIYVVPADQPAGIPQEPSAYQQSGLH